MSSELVELEREVDALPEGWDTRPLSRLCAEVADRVDPASLPRNLAAHYVGLEHIGQGSGRLEGVGSVADVVSQKSRFRSGDILYGKLRPNLRKVARPAFDGVCSTDVIVLRAKPTADPDFLFQVLQSEPLVAHAVATAAGTKMPRTHARSILSFEIAAPPLDEQRRIAEVLRSVDEAIAVAESAATQARCALDGLLFDYFSEDGAHASFSGLSPLSDLIVLQSGFAFKSDEYQDCGHFLMRISNVQDGQISLENPKFVRLDKKTQAFELQQGDILTSLTGNIGRVARLTADHLPAALNQRVARIKPKPGAPVDEDYLFFSLKSSLFKSGLAEESGGAAQQNVSPKAIGRVEIPLPPMAEQKRIGEMLSAVEDARVQCDYALEHLQNVKASVMSDLLSGRVWVPA